MTVYASSDINPETTIIESFDIDHPHYDQVAIHKSARPDKHGFEYYATPYVHYQENVYNEPWEWTSDQQFRDQIDQHLSKIPIYLIRLEPHLSELPTSADTTNGIFPEL